MKKSGKQSRVTISLRKQKATPLEKSSQPPVGKPLASPASSPKTPPSAFPIVGIGASAGGLDAFRQLLKHLPADTGMGFVLVQHLDPDHESALAQILARATSMPVREVAKGLARIARHPYVPGQRLSPGLSPLEGQKKKGAEFTERETRGKKGSQKILFLLRNHSGVDFSLYKSKTLPRRMARRMVLNKIDRPEAYATLLRGNPAELEALYTDLLINVTSFFRNPGAFEVLKRKVFPKLIQQPRDKPLRIWVPGCSTGQEAYSIVMSFLEFSEQAGHARTLRLFA